MAKQSSTNATWWMKKHTLGVCKQAVLLLIRWWWSYRLTRWWQCHQQRIHSVVWNINKYRMTSQCRVSMLSWVDWDFLDNTVAVFILGRVEKPAVWPCGTQARCQDEIFAAHPALGRITYCQLFHVAWKIIFHREIHLLITTHVGSLEQFKCIIEQTLRLIISKLNILSTTLKTVFKYTHRLDDKLIQNEILKKNNLLLIIVDVSASTGAFVGTVCLIAVAAHFRGEQDVVDAGELVSPRLCSSTCLALSWCVTYRLLDPSVHYVAFSVDERDSMICDCWLVLLTG